MGVYGLPNRPPRSVFMTDREMDDLPGFAKDIIIHQRKLERFCSAPIVNLNEAKKEFANRKFLARSAHRMWTNVDGSPAPRMR